MAECWCCARFGVKRPAGDDGLCDMCRNPEMCSAAARRKAAAERAAAGE